MTFSLLPSQQGGWTDDVLQNSAAVSPEERVLNPKELDLHCSRAVQGLRFLQTEGWE